MSTIVLHQRQRGFSLVELGVVMLIIGIIGILAWRWFVSTREPLLRPAILSHLSEAQAAVEGFVLAHHRLPCAAADIQGEEACTATNAVFFPWRSLGLGSGFSTLRYGINRGGPGLDLAVAPPTLASADLYFEYSPAIPVLALDSDTGVNAAADKVQVAIDAAKAKRHHLNGLDWCGVLQRFAANTSVAGVLKVGNATASVPAAFVLVHPGENQVFEGENATGATGNWPFDLPGRPQTTDFDDIAIAIGPADLSARLGCVGRLSGMQAAAQSAYTAYDNARVVQEYWSLRVFDIEQAESALQSAETGVALAAMNLALSAAGAALAVASAADTEGLTFAGIAAAAANAVIAAVEVGFADADLQEAKEVLQAAIDKEIAVRAYVIHIYENFAAALHAAVVLDAKGLNP